MTRVPAYLLDVAAVLVFVLIGRANHGEGETAAGIANTVWPFLAGLLAGWLLAARTHRRVDRLSGGTVVWIATVVGGLLLRVVAGQGVAFAFVVVAAVVLGVFLLGWRAISELVSRRRRGRAVPR